MKKDEKKQLDDRIAFLTNGTPSLDDIELLEYVIWRLCHCYYSQASNSVEVYEKHTDLINCLSNVNDKIVNEIWNRRI